jgi:hypothetical protein
MVKSFAKHANRLLILQLFTETTLMRITQLAGAKTRKDKNFPPKKL